MIQPIKPTKTILAPRYGQLRRPRVLRVTLHRVTRNTELLPESRHPLGIPTHRHDPRALARECPRRGKANPTCPSDHHQPLAIQCAHAPTLHPPPNPVKRKVSLYCYSDMIIRMARPVSQKVESLRRELRQRLSAGAGVPGERFLSNRELARQANVSYQTAARLLDELVRGGMLRRRHGSGTYIAGEPARARVVHLVFHPRGLRPESFGSRLHAMLRAALDEAGIHPKEHWSTQPPPLPDDAYPVYWEIHPGTGTALPRGQFALVLNNRPPPGLRARFIDSVQVDDFSGGCAAAELLRRRIGRRGAAIIAGPRGDPRSEARVTGYRTIYTTAPLTHARSWYREGAETAARRILARKPAGILCANDRLAEAIVHAYTRAGIPRPHLVGFDDAPVANELSLTTIAIPWDELVASATRIIAARLRGDTRPATQVILQPRATVRT